MDLRGQLVVPLIAQTVVSGRVNMSNDTLDIIAGIPYTLKFSHIFRESFVKIKTQFIDNWSENAQLHPTA